jgi:hypothetical protein
MKLPLLALILFLALDGLLYHGLRRVQSEAADLSRQREELDASAEAARETQERDRRAETLLRNASRSMGKVDRPLDIAELRDRLLEAERSLDIDRFSLEFHPAQDAPAEREGGRVSASLGGTFEALSAYLGRIEQERLPLSAETFSLRAAERGGILLTIEWRGRWSADDKDLEALSPQEIDRLERWLASEPAPSPGADFFGESGEKRAAGEPRLTAVPPLPREAVPSPDILASSPIVEEIRELPRLTGFVTARPEVESNLRRRVLAAIRFDGELRLVGIGDRIGAFEIEEIDGVESVVVLDSETGERLKLSLP